MDKETADTTRGMIRRVTLKNIKDDGQTQTASVEVADGIWRDDVEIMQPYGVAAHPPEDGALGFAVAIGGDQGDMALMMVGNPSKRMGNLPPGAVGVYNEHGDKMVITPDGKVAIDGASELMLTVGGVSFKITAGGVDITGGYVKHNGVNIGFDHHHQNVTPGGGESGNPV